ncbi:MAG: hypothetical protein JNL32_07410 [Candidatus Kapabacteria bacterium]|nr:hypothetical protein [Candidatus Kapabacteria bacterium]
MPPLIYLMLYLILLIIAVGYSIYVVVQFLNGTVKSNDISGLSSLLFILFFTTIFIRKYRELVIQNKTLLLNNSFKTTHIVTLANFVRIEPIVSLIFAIRLSSGEKLIFTLPWSKYYSMQHLTHKQIAEVVTDEIKGIIE